MNTARLSTGEWVTFRQRPDSTWQADTEIYDLPGVLDHHAIGPTPEIALRELESFIARRRAAYKDQK